MDHAEIEKVLETSEFFKGLEKSAIEKIAGLCQVRRYEPGEYVFCQGDCEQHLYIIAEGCVLLKRSLNAGTRKGSVVIGMLANKRVFGCWSALLGKVNYLLSSAVCEKPTRIVLIKGADLREMMVSDRELGVSMLKKLCFLLLDRMRGTYAAMKKI